MKERPIIFSGEMVRAILEGRKTMTRRPLKPQPFIITSGETPMGAKFMGWHKGGKCTDLFCLYGQPKDHLWVREKWGYYPSSLPEEKNIIFWADVEETISIKLMSIKFCTVWRPSIHMPRWASRITLEITDISIERLHDITNEDVRREGFVPRGDKYLRFADFWESIYGKDSWTQNPWVWVIKFKKLTISKRRSNLMVTEKKNISVVEKSVVDIVSEKVYEFLRSGELDLPKNYSVDNALKSAYLILNTVKNKDDKPVMLDGKLTGICTKASIANAVLDMVVQGLNPGKKQCYFIVYGQSIICQRSYFGSMAVAETVNPAIKDWGFNVVYEDDKFSYGIHNGKASVIEHEQRLENIDKSKIIAAYAMALDIKGEPIKTEIMTIEEIHKAWSMSKMKPIDDKGEVKPESTHGKFARDMALKTVINKTAKFIINASSDNALLLERINRAEDLADEAAVQMEIEESANKGTLIMIPEDKTQIEEKKVMPEEEVKPQGVKVEEKSNGQQIRQPGF